jgi:subtilisin family serine protease
MGFASESAAQNEHSYVSYSTLAQAQDAGVVADVPNDPQAYVEDEVLVVLAGEAPEAQELSAVEESISALSDMSETAEATVIDPEPKGDSTVLLELPTDVSVEEALLQMANDPSVAFAQPNYVYTLSDEEVIEGSRAQATSEYTPLRTLNDPRIGEQWWLSKVNAFGAWDSVLVNRAVTVAVVDTGVRLTHEDLKSNILTSLAWDAYRSQPLQTSVTKNQISNNGDMNGHGTHVAGIIAAEADNSVGGAGVSYNANILPINIFYLNASNEASASTGTLVIAYSYIMDHQREANIRVVNLSLGGDEDPAVHKAIIQANDAGILTVCAAGNAGEKVNVNADNAPTYPSDYDECVSVVSIDSLNNRAPYSEHNAYKDIAAPGTSILSTYCSNDTEYALGQGTSMASPVVAGTAALLFAKNPGLTCEQAKKVLYDTATDLGTSGWDKYYGWGLVNAQAVVATMPIPVSGVTLNEASKSLVAGTSFTLAATVSPFNATDKTVTWSSSNAAVATVSTSGKVTAVNAGSATITVTTKDGAKWATCAVTVTASPVLVPNGTYIIRTVDALSKTKAIDIQGASVANGAKVQTWDSNNTPAQRFRIERGSDGYYTIKNINSGKVLDVPSAQAISGQTLWQYAPNNTDAQKWVITENSDGSYTISPKLNTKLCLDIVGASSSNGAALQIYTKNGTNAQKFKLTVLAPALDNGTYTIGASYTNKVLDISGASTASGANVQLWVPNNTQAQRFRLAYDAATGYYTVTNVGSNRALDVSGAATFNGANVQQWIPNNTNAQRWTIEQVGSNYRLYAAHSGLVLDAAGAGTANGTNVQTWTGNGTGAQLWKFTKTG